METPRIRSLSSYKEELVAQIEIRVVRVSNELREHMLDHGFLLSRGCVGSRVVPSPNWPRLGGSASSARICVMNNASNSLELNELLWGSGVDRKVLRERKKLGSPVNNDPLPMELVLICSKPVLNGLFAQLYYPRLHTSAAVIKTRFQYCLDPNLWARFLFDCTKNVLEKRVYLDVKKVALQWVREGTRRRSKRM